jgi:hypothetical protein
MEDLGPIQDTGALPTRSHARGEMRPLQVHVSPAHAGRVQVGTGTDPRRRNMRRIHSSPRYPGLIPIATTRDQSLTSVKHEDCGLRPDV